MRRKYSSSLYSQIGFTLIEALIGLTLIMIAASSLLYARTMANGNAASARLYTQASMLVQNRIDAIQSDYPFYPDGVGNYAIPRYLALTSTSGTLQAVNIYSDPLGSGALVSGTMTTTVSDITLTGSAQPAYRATVRVNYRYRNRPYEVIMSTVRASDL